MESRPPAPMSPPSRATPRRLTLLALVVCLGGCAPAAAGVSPAARLSPTAQASPSGTAVPPSPSPTPLPELPLPGEAASLPAVPAGVPFTGHLLIAESSSHSRLLEIDAKGDVTWSFSTAAPPLAHPLGAPDDAFYTPDGSTILLSSEDGQGGMAIDRLSGRVRWQIGTYGVRGRDATHFNNPDDLVPAADGTAWLADIRNCRLLHLDAQTGAIIATLGAGGCRHDPPQQFSTPNGAFPTRDGSLVVTEINGSWVSWLNADGSVRWSHRVPAAYPSDAMAYPDGSVLLTDYSSLGQVLRIAPDGRVLWRYAPRGANQLNHTSIAIPLAVNRVAICDDYDNRIVIVDPTTSTVVWQWSGSGQYHLLRPDGLDYRPT
ncbi:MAG: outer membrane protein assembly factor BamB family protein [Candidatus Dormibacteria bacterium]